MASIEDKATDVNRQFTKAKTWFEFLSRCAEEDDEDRMTGLMHGTRSLVNQPEMIMREFCKEHGHFCIFPGSLQAVVDFFTQWRGSTNRTISQTAEQVFVRYWLGMIRNEANNPHCVYVQECTLFFLSLQLRALEKPPYPRMVAEHLTNMNCRLSHHVLNGEERLSELIP